MKGQAICGIIFNQQRDGVLLTKRRDIPVWVLPGGGLEPGESPEKGIVREMEEETGCRIKIIRKVAEYLPVNQMTQLTHFFECTISSGSPQVSSETQGVGFFPLTQLPLMPPPYANWIADAKASHPTILRKKIEGVSYGKLLQLMLQHPILVGRYLLTKLGIHIND